MSGPYRVERSERGWNVIVGPTPWHGEIWDDAEAQAYCDALNAAYAGGRAGGGNMEAIEARIRQFGDEAGRRSADGKTTTYSLCQEAASKAFYEAAAIVRTFAGQAGGGWRTDLDAAKQEDRVDLFGTAGKRSIRVPDCYWHKMAQAWMSKHFDREGFSALRKPFVPAHWMPLPKPPLLAPQADKDQQT